MRPTWLRWSPAAGLLLCLATMALGRAHPQDGAHADVRITIQDTGVRFEIALNLVFLDAVCPTTRESPASIHPVEEPGIQRTVLEYFNTRHRVEIDGVEVTPTLHTFAVVRPEAELLPLFPRTGARGLMRVRVDLEYSAKSPPKTVAMTWGGFPPDDINAKPGEDPQPLVVEAQLTAEGQFSIIRFTHTDPIHTWHASGISPADRFLAVPELEPIAPRFARIPVLSGLLILGLAGWIGVTAIRGRLRTRGVLLMAGAAVSLTSALLLRDVGPLRIRLSQPDGPRLPSSDEAKAIFSPLHANIYRAFDYDNESAIYDALARSVEGELLDELYNQIFRSLIMQEEGGAVSRVQAVRLKQTDVETVQADESGRPVFAVIARWQVDGVVYHYGHSHWRTNEYLARYTVDRGDAGWRIAATTVLEQFRVASGQIGDDTSSPVPSQPPGEL